MQTILRCAFLAAALAYDPIPYPACTTTEYFDISSLTCNSCPVGQKPDASGLSCQCDGGILQASATAAGVWECASCSALGLAPTQDGTACLPCFNGTIDNTTCLDNTTAAGANMTTAVSSGAASTAGFSDTLGLVNGECACPAGSALVERNGLGGLLPYKVCMPCPAASILNSEGECEACPADYMEAKQVVSLDGSSETECQCLDGYVEWPHQQGWGGRDSSCLEPTAYEEVRSYATSSADTVSYLDLVSSGSVAVTSKLFKQMLMPSATECNRAVQESVALPREQRLLQGNEACQALANLCVLQMYDEDSAACELYREMQQKSTAEVNSESEWKARLPALYYAPGPKVYTLNDVPLVVSLDGAASRLTYVLASYSLNGTYLGLLDLGDELQLCTGVAEDPTAFLKFGVGIEVECTLQLDKLLQTGEPTFYDLYLKVQDDQLYPIPVRLRNLRVDGRQVNINSDSVTSQQNDQLVRRFFTIDAASGLESGKTLPSVLRYVKQSRLITTIILFTPTKIYPPILELEYAEVQVPSAASAQSAAEVLGETLTSAFAAKYTMEMDETERIINILFVISLVLWVLGWLMQMYLWMRRNQRQLIDGSFLLKAVSQLCRIFSDVFFWLVFGSCGWLYCIFKNQDEVFIMMPLDSALHPFRAVLVCAFGAKCLWVLDMVKSQASHDVFFVDWEQPRGQQGEERLPVSVWRSVFVTNEWVKLQTSRAVYTEFNLLFLLFLLRGMDQEYFATEIPNKIGSRGITPNPLLRFALSSFMLLIMSLCQWLFRWAIWDRFVEDRVWQFVDLLAVTNISCFLMEEKYYGYYLHGRSVHSHADSDLLDFNRNLKREQDQLCAKRGLQEESDVQTFNIFISRPVREMYESIYEGSRSRLDGKKRGVDEKGRPRGFRASPEEALTRQKDVNTFLSSFVSNTLEAHKLEIRQKEYYERLVGLPPELGFSSKSVFLEDPAGSFKQLLLAGREYDLVILSALTYGTFDMFYEDTFIALFTTYLVDLGVRILRRELAKRNIAAKTLIDDRLLL